jgi:hypothetical protein
VKISCLHGYYEFIEEKSGEVARFQNLWKLNLKSLKSYYGIHYTFSDLIDVPKISVEGINFMGNEASVTHEGKPWVLFEKNALVYDFTVGRVRPIREIDNRVKIGQAGFYYVSDGLMLAGSRSEFGIVTDYYCTFLWDSLSFQYSWIGYGQNN